MYKVKRGMPCMVFVNVPKILKIGIICGKWRNSGRNNLKRTVRI